ncbi:hypothetical protein BKA70DRAFT_1307246 [Coprinopsis sp. MPI-PUGE-AT-0042]|nr:hypothetical protein BKA70DRAFT_1307246 [Coprinopsis sp. MPI-PUGE-AT-0042]
MSDSAASPVAEIPPEIWSIVFLFALGSNPFGREERRAFTCLRRVCSTWGRIVTTTPGLCPGLVLNLEKWGRDLEVAEAFEAKLLPWLAIIGQSQPYHLTIALDSLWSIQSDHCISLARYLLFEATPTPTSLSIYSFEMVNAILWMSESCSSIIHLDVNFNNDLDESSIYKLPLVFPQLKCFTTNARTSFKTSFGHPRLQGLTLLDIVGAPEDLAFLCMDLPCLRELRMSSEDIYELAEPFKPLVTPLAHLTLEILILEGEDTIPLLARLTLPSLKFLGLDAWGDSNGRRILEDNLPAFLQRSYLSNLTVSLKGYCYVPFFASLMQSLPPATTLISNFDFELDVDEEDEACNLISPIVAFRNIKRMICFYLSWLHECRPPSPPSGGSKIHTPLERLEKDEMGSLKEELTEKGFLLERCTLSAMDMILASSVPQMMIKWEL